MKDATAGDERVFHLRQLVKGAKDKADRAKEDYQQLQQVRIVAKTAPYLLCCATVQLV